MRFVAYSSNFKVGILARQVEILGGGVERELVPTFYAAFKSGDLRPDDIEFAERHLHLNGRTTEMDEVTLTPLYGRLSTYDTDDPNEVRQYNEIDRQMDGQWVPGGRERWVEGTMKALVEKKLLERMHNTYGRVVGAPTPPPWPNYDRFPGDEIELVGVLLDQGHHLPAVLAYERENQNRPEYVAALEQAVADGGFLTEENLAEHAAEYIQ